MSQFDERNQPAVIIDEEDIRHNTDLDLNPIPKLLRVSLNTNTTNIDLPLLRAFVFVPRIIVTIFYVLQTTDFTEYGGNAAALTNGWNLEYNGDNFFPDPIVATQTMAEYSHDWLRFTDGQGAAANNVDMFRLTFSKFMPHGLRTDGNNRVQMIIADDMRFVTIATTTIVTFEGFNWRKGQRSFDKNF